MMIRSKLKTSLSSDIPEVNFELLRSQTIQRIADYEEKRKREKLYFVPKGVVGLLWVLFILSFYTFMEEVLVSLFYISPTVREVGFNNAILSRLLFATVDNLMILGIIVSLMVILRPRLWRIRRLYTKAQAALYAVKAFVSQIPAVALGFVRRFI